MEHKLKIWPAFFHRVADGSKTFELRRNDRQFQAGDILRLEEFEPNPPRYTGMFLLRKVSYVLCDAEEFGLQKGFCILGLADYSPAQEVRNG